VEVVVLAATLCPRYIGVRVDGVAVAPAPDDIAAKLTAIGGRSINNIVDLTNYVLFDIGQPMHAFDAAKVAGGITVRSAVAGESMTTLDDKALTFDGTELVIADDEGVLALAGVKGGKKAEVDTSTTSIIFESANFDPTLTRRTSTKHGIKTDASKRYENGMTSKFAEEGMHLALSELVKIMPSAKIGAMTDVYPTPEKGGYHMNISADEINRLLGSIMNNANVSEVLSRLGFTYTMIGNDYEIIIPNERLDLRIKQDLIEEVGRNYGYDRINSTLPKLSRRGVPHKRLYYANKVRNFLVGRGYSEVFTYSFAPKGEGEVEVLNPVGKDRPFMRSSLVSGMKRALTANFYNAPLLELEDIKIFEIGNVFSQSGERMKLAIGAMGGTKKRWKVLEVEFKKTTQEMISEVFGDEHKDRLRSDLGSERSYLEEVGGPDGQSGIVEFDFDGIIANLPEPTAYEELAREKNDISYQTLSVYPFIVRDIAIFVPQEVSEEYIETLLKKEAGQLVVRFSQFDKFQKPGESRISYAYRMVFQSFERTLTDDEVGIIMERATLACNKESDWQVR
jgi:phenylalanyl-tRNA synthetase beta chain